MANDEQDIELKQGVLLADVVLRITALENLLMKKSLLSEAEIETELNLLRTELMNRTIFLKGRY